MVQLKIQMMIIFIVSYFTCVVYSKEGSWYTYPADSSDYIGYADSDCQACQLIHKGTHCINKYFRTSMCCNFKDAAKQKTCTDRYDYCGGPDQSWGSAALNCQQFQKCPASLIVYRNTKLNYEKKYLIDEAKDEQVSNCKFQFLANPDFKGKLRVKIEKSKNAVIDIISFPDPAIYGEQFGYKGKFKNTNYEVGRTDGVFEAPSDWVIFVNYKFTEGTSFVDVRSSIVEYTSDDYIKHAPKSSFEWSPSSTYAAFRKKESKNTQTAEQKERIRKIKEKFLKTEKQKEKGNVEEKEVKKPDVPLTPAERAQMMFIFIGAGIVGLICLITLIVLLRRKLEDNKIRAIELAKNEQAEFEIKNTVLDETNPAMQVNPLNAMFDAPAPPKKKYEPFSKFDKEDAGYLAAKTNKPAFADL